jgi:hypothetical protein
MTSKMLSLWLYPPHMVSSQCFSKGFSDASSVDVEVEDLELGPVEQSDLAFDVDGEPDGDPDALDSDDNSMIDDEALGIDPDECNGEAVIFFLPVSNLLPKYPCMLFRYILYCLVRSRCGCLNLPRRDLA